MTVDHVSTYVLPGGYIVTITVYREVEIFNFVSVGKQKPLRFMRSYWTPLKDCKKTAKQQLKKYQDKKNKYSKAQKKIMTEQQAIDAALKMKKGRRLLTQELTIIGLMFEYDNYQMYVNENGNIGFKLKEVPNA